MSTTIRINCTDQVLTPVNTPVIASGGLGEDFVAFTFCSKWDGMVKTAVFWRSPENAYHVLLDEDDICAIPPEILPTAGTMYFGVFGVAPDGRRRTSEVLRYNVAEGAITEGTQPSDPTPELWDQLLAAAAEALVASENKTDKVAGAKAGNFAGLDAEGNLTDSGRSSNSFAPSDHTHSAEDVGARPNTWTPTAEEVGARPNTWTPTAEDVGARPNTWTPTAEDVGARPDTWTPTAEDVGARPNTWTPTAEDVGARPDTWLPTLAEIGITAGTADLTAGTSALTSGSYYNVYE